MSASAPQAAVRRARKRRRRQASYSASSSSFDHSSADDVQPTKVTAKGMEVDQSSSATSSSSASSSSSSSSSGSEDDDTESDNPASTTAIYTNPPKTREIHRHPTLSPTPPPTSLPSFLPPIASRDTDIDDGEEDRRARFRRVYMENLVQGFGSDLEKLRAAEPTMGQSRLGLLIDSLAAGVDVYNDPKMGSKRDGVDEVGVILGDQ